MRWRVLGLALLIVAALAGCTSPAPKPDPPADCASGQCLYVGVAAVRASALPSFERATRVKPTVVESYMTFGAPLDTQNVSTMMRDGALPLIQLNPFKTPLAAIATGQDDAYLKSLALALRQLGGRVVLSFAAESDGTWYPWSCNHTPAPTYVAAWQRVHDVVAQYDKSIIWMWDVNVLFPGSCSLASHWPGAADVDWVGVDGYLRNPGDSFDTVLAPTVTQARASFGKPVLIAETGVPDVPEAASWLQSVFEGAENVPGVLGLVYFDTATADYNYRLEHDIPALLVFRQEAKVYKARKW